MRRHIAAMAASLAMMGLATDICAQQIPRAEVFGAPWQPGLFSHVAAGSPSIWTDPEALEASATPYGAPVLITVGALETPEAAQAAGQPADRIARLRERDMVGRAQRMADNLNAPFMEIPGATHGASVTGFLVRAVSFLWQTPVN